MAKRKGLREEELVALTQRHQLERLQKHFILIESCTGKLESETRLQAEQLRAIEEQLELLSANTSLPRIAEQPVVHSEIAAALQITSGEQAELASGLPRLSFDLQLPNAEESWPAFMADVRAYVEQEGIDTDRDPFAQLLTPSQVSQIHKRFQDDFGPVPWDKWDYAAVGIAVLAGSLLDYFLVSVPPMTFKGAEYSGSPLTRWMQDQSERVVAAQKGSSNESNAFIRWLAGKSRDAEGIAKVPYDIANNREVTEKLSGLRPAMHRIMSPGHDPIAGFYYGVRDILSGTCTLIDSDGAWRVIDASMRTGSVSATVTNPLQAFTQVALHLLSDVFTPAGLPAPFMTVLQGLTVDSGFTISQGTKTNPAETVSVNNLIRYMYANGYDLRHFLTMSIVPAIAEIIIRTYHGVRMYGESSGAGVGGIRGKMKQAQLLLLTHTLLGSTNIAKTALYGWNPLALNYPQFLVLGKQLISTFQLAMKRDRLIEKQLTDAMTSVYQEISYAHGSGR